MNATFCIHLQQNCHTPKDSDRYFVDYDFGGGGGGDGDASVVLKK